MDDGIALGRSYLFGDRIVVVIQLWSDPFGRGMVYIRTDDNRRPGEDGLLAEEFLATAKPLHLPINLPD